MKPKMQWDTSKRAEILRLRYPLGDKDKDRVPNVFDCQPFDPLEQGFFDWVSKGVATVKKTFTPVVQKVTPVFEEVESKISAIKPVIKKYAKEISAKPTSLTGLYLREVSKPKVSKPEAKTKPAPSTYEKVLAPSLTHFKIVSEVAGKGEKIYEEKVAKPVETVVLGEREKALREQAQKVESSYKEVEKSYEEVKKHKKPEWKRGKEGAVILPTEPAPEVKAWEQRWKPYIKGEKFTGTEAQYQQYTRGFRKYYKKTGENQYMLREQYLKLTPEAQRYEQSLKRYSEKVERYKKETEKYKRMPQPGLIRQFTAGAVGTIVGMPGFVAFGVPRIATEAIAKPTAVPSKAISYGKSMIGLAKERPAYFAGSMAGMVALGEFGRLKPYVERLSPLYVSPKRITLTPVLEEKMPSTGRVPVTTPAKTLKEMMEEPTFKLTAKPEEVWHATPSRWAVSKGGIVFTAPGRSATKGVYVGPAAYPKFAVGSIIEAPRRVRTPTGGEPTLYSIITRGIEIPKEAKVTKSEIIAAKRILGGRVVPGSDIVAFAKYKRYVERIAPKGYAYISPEATAKLPWRGYLEVEAVIPPLSRLKEPLGSRVFTRFTYVKVPRYRLTRAGRRLFKSFEKEWQKKFKEAKTEPERIKLRSEYEKAEAKLLKKLKEEGELKQKGYEHVKLSVRRLVSSELSKEEIKKASEPLGGLTGRLERAPKIEVGEFRAGEIMWRTPRRLYGYPFLIRPPSGIIAERGRGITERRISRRITEPLRLPEQRRHPISERRKKREPERGRRIGRYKPPARRWLIPERGRGYEQYPPRERHRPREEEYREEEYPLRLPERIPPERGREGREEKGRRGERRAPEYGRDYGRYLSRRRYPPERTPSILPSKVRPYYPLIPKLKVKKRRKKPKEEWGKYLEIAPIRMPKEIMKDTISILGGGMKK